MGKNGYKQENFDPHKSSEVKFKYERVSKNMKKMSDLKLESENREDRNIHFNKKKLE